MLLLSVVTVLVRQVDNCIEILPYWSIVVQLFTALLQYSFMSLENSEHLFSGNLDGVSYSIILPAHQEKNSIHFGKQRSEV
jgi:hypothetical protein